MLHSTSTAPTNTTLTSKGLLFLTYALLFSCIFNLYGCVSIDLGGNYSSPLQREILVNGNNNKRIALIDVSGIISSQGGRSMLGSSPSTVEHMVMQLRAAAASDDIKAVVIKINSPGGGVTASDIIYQEIMNFKQHSGKKVIAIMMDVAASGGYYIALPADHIVAHPSTVTGSVGVIMAAPNFTKLMDKIGVEFMVYKSGENKDAGSPFRTPSESDKELMRGLNTDMAKRFHSLVEKHRTITSANMDLIKTARVFTGNKAKEIGLVDEVGYLSDGLNKACELINDSAKKTAHKPCEVIAFRYTHNANDTVYHSSAQAQAQTPALVAMPSILKPLDIKPGHYYLWPAGI